MTTRKAFEKMINVRGIHEKLGISSDKVRNYRARLKSDQVISLDLMEELLQKAGWVVVQEKQWEETYFVTFENATTIKAQKNSDVKAIHHKKRN